jgi:stage V sporulation protein SpoVS
MATSNPQNPAPDNTAHPARRRADWEAIERDYRTGQFSDQELADKHGNIVSRQAISKRAKVQGWQKDLSREVRQATKAKLIADQVREKVAGEVAERVAKSGNATVQAVLAAAETNKQVILGHRRDIAKVRDITMTLVDALETAASEKDESKRLPLGDLVLTAQRAGQSLSRLQQMERVAFGLDEEDDSAGAAGVSKLTDAQRAARLAALTALAQKRKEEGGDAS